jgi:amidophosphoribosyltransferase
MGGFFGVVSKVDCVADLFYGTDYHSHLGTRRGGLAVQGEEGLVRIIHDITNSQFRTKFDDDIRRMHGRMGIGIISDTEDQPLLIRSHLGNYAIVTVGAIRNAEALVQRAFRARATHFSEMSDGEINPTELVATLINQGATFEEGIRHAQEQIEGSCSLLLLTKDGLYAARDYLGRTPIVIGRGENGYAATMESCALPNLGYLTERFLGPGEVVRMDESGVHCLLPPGDRMQICSFLWIYYGYPSSHYENINVEVSRNRCGVMLARRETESADSVSGIPDSGIGHAIGFSNESGIPYRRPFTKYTPTWPRSFMPQDQRMRDLVARMKLIPIPELIRRKKLLFCEDSIVRGTQLCDTIHRLFTLGASEIHMRPACPPLMFKCPFLNFSRSKSEQDLVTRKVISELEGAPDVDLAEYAREGSDKQEAMIGAVARRLGLTTLRYQRLSDMIEAIGMPAECVCTACWTGTEGPSAARPCRPDPKKSEAGAPGTGAR